MREPQNVHDIIKILRTADIATLWEYSQHMAEVLESAAADLATFHNLVRYVEDVTVQGLGQPLTHLNMVAILPDALLRDLLGVLADEMSD